MNRTSGYAPPAFKQIFLTSLAWIALSSCGGSDSPSSLPQEQDPPVPASIALSATSLAFVSLGDIHQLSATVRDQNGAVMSAQTVSWSSSDAQVASVSSGGQVTAVGNGSATLTASVGSVSATASAVVQQVVVSLRFDDDVVTVGTGAGPAALTPIAEDANGHSAPLGTLQWSSTGPGVIAVDGAGTVSALSPGWARVTATLGDVTASTTVHAVSPGFPGTPQPVRALHLGGNWLGNELHAGVPHEDFIRFIESLDVNWVGVSVGLSYGESTDPIVRPNYDQPGPKTFSDEVLRTLIREFRSRGIDVYVTLAFEVEPEPGSKQQERWMLGLPWLDTGVQAEDWPWLPTHPDHDTFVAQFWRSYTDQAVHFATIAEEEGATLFSVGTETDHLFRTRAEGQWVSEYRDEIRTMVTEVRQVFSGSVTYDQLVWVHQQPQNFGMGLPYLWEDGGFDAIGLSGWFSLVEETPVSVMTVEELQTAWESIFTGTLVPLQQANPGRPIMLTEVGFVDDVRAPADPTIDEFDPKVLLDQNGNGLDDGRETQANIIEAFYRTLGAYPALQGAFWWDHAMDSDADVAYLSDLASTRVRGKLAESVLKLAYRGGG